MRGVDFVLQKLILGSTGSVSVLRKLPEDSENQLKFSEILREPPRSAEILRNPTESFRNLAENPPETAQANARTQTQNNQ